MGALIRVLIGHRGVGKTTLLSRLAPHVATLDLDQEIERETGKSIAELLTQSEREFRKLEHKILSDLVATLKEITVVAVGAGFEGRMPEGVHVIWIRRATDSVGRSFLNRPRLDANVSPMEEYLERFATREARFAEWAHEEILLPEGEIAGLEDLVLAKTLMVPYALTLLPENFRDLEAFVQRRDVKLWEIRDDLLDEEQIERALSLLPKSRRMYSCRRRGAPVGERIDWALELGPPPGPVYSLSLHEREEDFASTLLKLRGESEILKLAVEVKDFTELQQGHHWCLEDPARRSFLPRSKHGRWRWYRSLFGPRMPLHFVREGSGSALDQPPLWQMLLQPPFQSEFAAVVGSPVEHSRTPMEQREFFRARAMPVVAIDIPEEEFTVALKFLRELGLTHAAVTSPLKKLAWACADRLTPEARQMQAANTLQWLGGWHAHNTDLLALREVRDLLPNYENIWLWGGGGVKLAVKSVWPAAQEVSARKGDAPPGTPQMVIWATGRSRRFVFPRVRPEMVLDLNYGDDSPGLEWAVREGLKYQSGLTMFQLQAKHQRAFWQGVDV